MSNERSDVKYEKYISDRDMIRKNLPNSISVGGYAMFKNKSHALELCEKDPSLFVITLEVIQWSHTDMYPVLNDGLIENSDVFGYFIGIGSPRNEKSCFQDFPYR